MRKPEESECELYINRSPSKTTSKGGRSSRGSPRRKPRGAGAGEINEAEKGKSFKKEELPVNRVKCCINVKKDDKRKWGH